MILQAPSNPVEIAKMLVFNQDFSHAVGKKLFIGYLKNI